MSEDWRDRRVARLEDELTSLRGDMWGLEADVHRRFWEQNQERWERGNRQLRFVGYLIVGLVWIAYGAVVAAAILER